MRLRHQLTSFRKMASTSRENTFNRDEVLAMLDVNESDGGMSSGEESELDREGYEESR